jgi:hypothetical protein
MTAGANPIVEAANALASANDSDIFLLNAPFQHGVDRAVADIVVKRKRRTNATVVIVSYGGDADVAYRIARLFQNKYAKFTAIISGTCKSAGTLCILGAHELAFGDFGELGPLDIQYQKKDEIAAELSSGLVVREALNKLQSHAFQVFEQSMLGIIGKSGGNITFKLASDVATGLCEPLYRQIDPMQLGELERGMTIAKDYGERLRVRGKNFSAESLEKLAESYSSHSFVIDAREAKELFTTVRDCTDAESQLIEALNELALTPSLKTVALYLSTELGVTSHENAAENAANASPDQAVGGTGGDAPHPGPADAASAVGTAGNSESGTAGA